MTPDHCAGSRHLAALAPASVLALSVLLSPSVAFAEIDRGAIDEALRIPLYLAGALMLISLGLSLIGLGLRAVAKIAERFLGKNRRDS